MLLLISLILVACGGATPEPTGPPPLNAAATVSISGAETNDRLLALLTRLADERTPLTENSQLVPQSPVITVGDLPTAMPFVVPLEPQTVILGSIVRENSLRGEGLILLDVPLPAAEIVGFYQSALASQGFTPWQPGRPEAFLPTNRVALFCQRDKSIQLELEAYESPGHPTDVRLAYDTNPLVVSCNQPEPNMTTYAESIVPGLTLPPDIVQLGTGGGGNYEGWAYSQRDILTDKTPAELAQFLRPQIQNDGWQRVGESETGPVAWSQWTRTDSQGYRWSGVLTITAGQGSENSRVLIFQIERVI